MKKSMGNFFIVTRNPKTGELIALTTEYLNDQPKIATFPTIQKAQEAAARSVPVQAWGACIMEYAGVGSVGV